MDKNKPLEVTATIAFQNSRGARAYRTAIYRVSQWQDAMVDLFTTVAWQALDKEFNGEPFIFGVTFGFKNKEL